jgi:carboxyl-terminal processing protease|uniref:S41 family peptidase n=1 Tax=Acidicaldus sp. TaxID=1872105 RepID=A0A8J4M4P0_9PROT
MKLRTGLLLGATFLAGITCAPEAGRLARHFGASLGIAPAFAEATTDSADTYRLLSLFGDVFERVRADYVEPVPDRELVENSINGMLTGLDPHSSYMNAKAFQDMQVQTRGEFGGLGLEVTQDNGFIKVISPIDDTPAARAGIKAGDLILALDGKSVQGLTLNDAVDHMRGPPDSKITLTIKREGVEKPIEVSMKREIIHIQVVRSSLEGDIGYIRLSQFTEQSDAGIRQAIAKLQSQAGGHIKGYVFDLRNNPGGLLDQAVAVSNDFLNHGEIVSTRARHPDDSQRWDAKAGGDLTDGAPLVVLINSGSASASEIVSGALQDDRRAVLLGTRSFGKGSVQTVIPLPGNNGAIRLTTARYYTPSGRSIQGLGIVPDVEVHESREAAGAMLPEREADLNHIITNSGGTNSGASQPAPPARNDLPPLAKDLPQRPPADWPTFDPTKPATDFQLQQALKLVNALAAMKRASAN